MKKLLQLIPRPGLLWLSRRDVKAVRDRVIGLYLSQGEYYEAAAPSDFFGIEGGKVAFTGSIAPCFLYVINGEEHAFWLKVPLGHNPYWDYKRGDAEIVRLAFSDPKAVMVSRLVCHWFRYFPYLPTKNFLQKGGDFVA